jgi:hypothetical protein
MLVYCFYISLLHFHKLKIWEKRFNCSYSRVWFWIPFLCSRTNHFANLLPDQITSKEDIKKISNEQNHKIYFFPYFCQAFRSIDYRTPLYLIFLLVLSVTTDILSVGLVRSSSQLQVLKIQKQLFIPQSSARTYTFAHYHIYAVFFSTFIFLPFGQLSFSRFHQFVFLYFFTLSQHILTITNSLSESYFSSLFLTQQMSRYIFFNKKHVEKRPKRKKTKAKCQDI